LEKETLEMQYKTIKVSSRHYDELSKLGEVKDSFDKVIGKLLETRTNGGT
jgi:predicted CopG family antitoxin